MDGQTGTVSCNTSCQLNLQACTRVQAVRLSLGEEHSCSVSAVNNLTGAVHCWGSNAFAQLSAIVPFIDEPSVISSAGQTLSVASGGDHVCALNAAGEVRCWGANGSGQLGRGPGGMTQSRFVEQVMGLGGVAVSVGTGVLRRVARRETVAAPR